MTRETLTPKKAMSSRLVLLALAIALFVLSPFKLMSQAEQAMASTCVKEAMACCIKEVDATSPAAGSQTPAGSPARALSPERAALEAVSENCCCCSEAPVIPGNLEAGTTPPSQNTKFVSIKSSLPLAVAGLSNLAPPPDWSGDRAIKPLMRSPKLPIYLQTRQLLI
ncbi:MAG: hypothetical protein IPK73_25975 [Candidatus Obscuribacter sp.]|nr:hypothetical protein [Candidatus Obscuribacter sp.]MBK9277573.1 hypothetical protein [Candidatus Obscuribacter sp.]MBL8085951.1 hypothetical protein [Candidatus Obscuribacter sp.]